MKTFFKKIEKKNGYTEFSVQFGKVDEHGEIEDLYYDIDGVVRDGRVTLRIQDAITGDYLTISLENLARIFAYIENEVLKEVTENEY